MSSQTQLMCILAPSHNGDAAQVSRFCLGTLHQQTDINYVYAMQWTRNIARQEGRKEIATTPSCNFPNCGPPIGIMVNKIQKPKTASSQSALSAALAWSGQCSGLWLIPNVCLHVEHPRPGECMDGEEIVVPGDVVGFPSTSGSWQTFTSVGENHSGRVKHTTPLGSPVHFVSLAGSNGRKILANGERSANRTFR